jgi:hypothetical protein
MNSAIKLVTRSLLLMLLLSACATSPPRNTSDICRIFSEKDSWYKKANKASKRWGSSVPVMMAIMHQESRFKAKARPPRTSILWVFPGPRKSNSYGYSQAKKSTWSWYQKSANRGGADRDDFGDAIDFIGWYNSMTNKKNRVPLSDTYNLYLAYHEGHGGHARGSYNKKAWLKSVARKVSNRAITYQQQLQGCERRLKKSSSFWFF